METRLVTEQGIIREKVATGTNYEEILRVGQRTADKNKELIRAYQGLRKIATFKPE